MVSKAPLLGTGLLLIGCSSGIPAELVVAPLGATGAASGSQTQALGPDGMTEDRGPPPSESLGAYGYAQLDGIRLDVDGLGLEGTDGSRHFVGIHEMVELQPGADELSFSQPISVPHGDFRSARLEFDAAYSIKASCRTASRLVYTTAAGVQALDCAEADCDAPLPADYDFHRYEFIYVTTAEGAQETGDRAQEETLEPFTIEITATPRVAVLVDTSYLATCYDGTEPVGSHGAAYAPFSFDPNRAGLAKSDFFPDGAPAFGIGYLPLFVWVSGDPSEALPTAETYVAGPSAEMLDPEGMDLADALVTTYAFRADGSVLAARARNFDLAQVPLNQYFSGFAHRGEGAYDFFNGEFYWSDSDPGRYIADRRIVGFTRSEIGNAPFETVLMDGPECGQQMLTEHGNQSRECMGEAVSAPIWWRRLPR